MAELVYAVEAVVALPAYRRRILEDAPAIAQHDPDGPFGVFLGYDFHVHEHGIGLIEINTNAGGAMLNAVLARAQRACCAGMSKIVSGAETADALERRIVDMFFAEWNASTPERSLTTIAIIDLAPEQQCRYPEFLLFQRLFIQHGIDAVICDPPSDVGWRSAVVRLEAG
jgi:hypothetical protein